MPTFHLSSPLRRLLAMFIDGLALLATALPWIWTCLPPGEPARPLAMAGGLLLLSTAAVPCWLWLGATPGQLLLSLRVVDAAGARHLALDQAVLRWLGAVGGLLAGGVGLLWMVFDARRQAWPDKLARTLVVEPGFDDASATTTDTGSSTGSGATLRRRRSTLSYGRQHLRGDLPVGQSLWMNGVLFALPLWVALGALDAFTRLHGRHLWLGSVGLLLGWALLLALLAWGAVGVWRSSRRPPLQASRSDRVVSVLAPAAMAVVVALAGLMLVLNLGPRLGELALALIGRDPLGRLDAQVSADGRRLQLRGPVAHGDARRVLDLMAAAPQLRMVTLQSGHGRIDEALGIAAAVRARGLQTRATGPCHVACPFIFLAGSKRQLLPGARLGFHRVSAGGFNPPYQALLNRSLRHLFEQAGLTPHMATKGVATPPSTLWVPGGDELASARLVTVPDRPLDVDLPAAPGSSQAEYAEALSASPLWQSLERRYPGAQAEAALRMHAASAEGPAGVQSAGHEVVALLLPGLLAQASAETRWLYVEVLLAQINALRLLDPQACRSLLLGDPLAHRRLPPDLAWREAEWLLGALKEAPANQAARRPTALELEVIRRTLGPRAPVQLATLWRPATAPSAREPDCNVAEALLAELGALAAPQRRLALRLMFDRE